MNIKIIKLWNNYYSVNGETIKAENSKEAMETYLQSHSSGEKIYYIGG